MAIVDYVFSELMMSSLTTTCLRMRLLKSGFYTDHLEGTKMLSDSWKASSKFTYNQFFRSFISLLRFP